MARRQQPVELEDVTTLAGWMYADLLLALMVIFLATISFVPRFSASSNGVTQSSTAQTDLGKNYKLGLALVYSSFDPKKVTEDVAAFKLHENLKMDSQILYAQITGGYLGDSETAETGRVRALTYSLRLRRALPDIFTNAPTYLAASSKLKKNEIGLRLTFTQKTG
jgi:hypothetical protein